MNPIELIAVFSAILYLVLAVRQNILCWSAWIISSCLYFFIMIEANLYMEALLQIFYIVMGIYGWMQWNKGGSEGGFEVNTMTSAQHVKVLGCILFLSIFFGLFLEKFTDAALPFWDSLTTWGAVLTTYLVAKKFIENWMYWFFNGKAVIKGRLDALKTFSALKKYCKSKDIGEPFAYKVYK